MDRYGYGDGKPGNPSVGYVATMQLKDIRKRLPLRVLSAADWQHWTTWGYVVVKNAIPAENVRRLVDLLWEFQEMDPQDPSTWYKPQLRDNEMKELNNSGMVELYNHQCLWDNRQHPRIHDAFVDIWDQEELWVTIDRANLNPPNRDTRSFNGPSKRYSRGAFCSMRMTAAGSIELRSSNVTVPPCGPRSRRRIPSARAVSLSPSSTRCWKKRRAFAKPSGSKLV